MVTTVAPNLQYFRHTGITGSHTLQYQVQAIYSTAATDFSNTATALVLAQPLGLNAQALNSGQVEVRWNDHATNETGYEIWRGVGVGALTLLQSIGANSVTYLDSTVTANQTYRYQVRCVNGAHASSFTNLDTVPVMLAPTNLAGNAVSSTQIDLTWTDNSAGLEGGFQIYRRQGFNAFKLVGSVGANVTNYSDTTVNGGQPYDYAVRAVNGVDWSSFTPTTTVTTP
jgi:titin